MKTPIYVTRPYLPPREDFNHEIDKIWERDILTNNGEEVQSLQLALQKFLEAPEVNLCVNGHQALEIAIKGLHLSGEVITTPFTFASTPHALSLNGIKPVFCDIREDNLTMDPSGIEELITEKTTAILPVHVYGHPCDVAKIDCIAKKHNLKVVYDAAHAFGVTVNGKNLPLAGDVSMLSFHATKLFHTIEGGALVYCEKEFTRIFNAYKNFGIEGEEHVNYVGGNAKMNEFQAAMGLCNLPHIGELIAERREITLRYREHLEGVKGLRYFEPEKDLAVSYNYAYFPILIDASDFGETREEVYERLKCRNIFTRRYFWPIVPDYECYRQNYSQAALPITRKVGTQVLCLPIYNGLSLETVDKICKELINKT